MVKHTQTQCVHVVGNRVLRSPATKTPLIKTPPPSPSPSSSAQLSFSSSPSPLCRHRSTVTDISTSSSLRTTDATAIRYRLSTRLRAFSASSSGPPPVYYQPPHPSSCSNNHYTPSIYTVWTPGVPVRLRASTPRSSKTGNPILLSPLHRGNIRPSGIPAKTRVRLMLQTWWTWGLFRGPLASVIPMRRL